ncbi:hypothetical protein DFS33DRAFT_1457411 [Desarmillaria ectypa]|nr:hypothetical protein DFS33DRAFT_1457411 [Desarmillaria ectypa]
MDDFETSKGILSLSTRAMREVEWHPLLMEKGIEKDAPKLWEAWARLKNALGTLMEMRKHYLWKDKAECMNTKCTLPAQVTPEALLPLLKKLFQKEAWNSEHREIFTQIGKNRRSKATSFKLNSKGHPLPTNQRNGTFLSYLVTCDMKKNPDYIKTLRKEFAVNYLVVPRTFSAFSELVYRKKPHWDQHVADERAGKGQLVFLSAPHAPDASHELKLIRGI